jgi:hypothetical protein
MAYLIAISILMVLLIFLVAFAIVRDYNVEFTFHPPIFIKIKLTRTHRS